jgi:hypothetical protein
MDTDMFKGVFYSDFIRLSIKKTSNLTLKQNGQKDSRRWVKGLIYGFSTFI